MTQMTQTTLMTLMNLMTTDGRAMDNRTNTATVKQDPIGQ
jgi:hypothetical protein